MKNSFKKLLIRYSGIKILYIYIYIYIRYQITKFSNYKTPQYAYLPSSFFFSIFLVCQNLKEKPNIKQLNTHKPPIQNLFSIDSKIVCFTAPLFFMLKFFSNLFLFDLYIKKILLFFCKFLSIFPLQVLLLKQLSLEKVNF